MSEPGSLVQMSRELVKYKNLVSSLEQKYAFSAQLYLESPELME